MKKTMQMNFVDYDFYINRQNKRNAVIAGLFKFDNPNHLDYAQKVKENIQNRINIFPILSSIVQESKIKNDFPYFVVDSNFNINNHIFSYNIFSDEEFKTTINSILAKEIDFKKPLWEFHIINYKDSSYVLRRAHHAMGDGTQLSNAVSFSDEPSNIKPGLTLSKVGKIRSYYNKLCKTIKYYYLILFGFFKKTNQQLHVQQFSRDGIYRGDWRPKRNYSLDYSFLVFNLNEFNDLLKKNNISTLDLCYLINTLCYQQILGEKVLNKKDLISIFPRNYSKIKHYGNEIVVANIDIPTSESSIEKILERIKLSISSQNNIFDTSPHVYYAAALRANPKISSSKKSFKFVNSSDWNNRKKIPRYRKEFSPIATSTSYYNARAVSEIKVFGEKIKESYAISMPLNVPGSIGISTAFRKEKENLYVTISTFKEIIEAEKVKKNMIISLDRIKEYFKD